MEYFGNKEVFAVAYELKESSFSECGRDEPI